MITYEYKNKDDDGSIIEIKQWSDSKDNITLYVKSSHLTDWSFYEISVEEFLKIADQLR